MTIHFDMQLGQAGVGTFADDSKEFIVLVETFDGLEFEVWVAKAFLDVSGSPMAVFKAATSEELNKKLLRVVEAYARGTEIPKLTSMQRKTYFSLCSDA
ncbi:MAG TPA: hypothetical protein VM577_03655 [Anaerovoracaceae bacterium]|nr:hypothetical protein [Anaerovoracaceae bacterium]